jgi:hypothetical protein
MVTNFRCLCIVLKAEMKSVVMRLIDLSAGRLFLMLQSKEQLKMIEKPVMKSDSGTQTDTHFYESNIVASYEWNEWELRRKAIKLVSLSVYCAVIDLVIIA